MSTNNTNNTKGDVFLGTPAPPGKPKGLLDAISEIQQFFVVEKGGSEIPNDFLTFKGKMGFFEVGFKGGFVSGLVSALLTPLAIGVMEKYIPIFGSYNPTTYDEVFAFVLAISFSLGYASFLAVLGKYYVGNLTKAAINNLLLGLFARAILKFFVALILFNYLYVKVLEPAKLASTLLTLSGFFAYETLNTVYLWLIDFRKVFPTSTVFVGLSTLLVVIIPTGSIFINSRKTKKMLEKQEFWK